MAKSKAKSGSRSRSRSRSRKNAETSSGSGKGRSKGTKGKSNVNEHSKEIHYEFGGPVGAVGVMVGLPFVVYLLHFACNHDYCFGTSAYGGWDVGRLVVVVQEALLSPDALDKLFSWEAW